MSTRSSVTCARSLGRGFPFPAWRSVVKTPLGSALTGAVAKRAGMPYLESDGRCGWSCWKIVLFTALDLRIHFQVIPQIASVIGGL